MDRPLQTTSTPAVSTAAKEATHSDPPDLDPAQLGPMKRLSLSTLLDDIRSKLIRIQDELSAANKKVAAGQSRILLEISKIVFGGWPAFAIVFVIAFYFPLRNVAEIYS